MDILFFGCNHDTGHYYWESDAFKSRDFDAERFGFPKALHFDGGPFLPPKERLGTGALTYLAAIDVTVLSWWGSPWDKRGAVCNAILVKGRRTASYCWKLFRLRFPKLNAALQFPEIVATYLQEGK